MSEFHCCDARRREAALATGADQPPNGIDFLDVVDSEAEVEADRQRVLRVHFLKAVTDPLLGITAEDTHVDGGTRVTGIRVEGIEWDGDVLEVRVDRPGDFSAYTLRLGESNAPYPGLDPLLASVDFVFKADCPTDFDCLDDAPCGDPPQDTPDIDYLARDYAGFRRLMLDRLAVTTPDWQERNPADLGVALVEVLAYAADHLSYQIDAIGMESTLATARRRTSARRHARLVDYAVHDGSNARTWVHLTVDAAEVTVPTGTQLLTRVPGLSPRLSPPSSAANRAFDSGATVFETMHDTVAKAAANRMPLHTWGDRECCLPAGATNATLVGHPPLAVGDVLVLVEREGPGTGNPADADPAHRHAVRLTAVEPTTDPLGSWTPDEGLPPSPVDVTRISWADADALPFALCVTAVIEGTFHAEVSVALGNMVLADHGRTVQEPLEPVPAPDRRLALATTATGHCTTPEPVPTPARYEPVLDRSPVTMTGTVGRATGADQRVWQAFGTESAAAAYQWQPRHVLPAITLAETDTGRLWQPRRDLIASGRFTPEFVAEIDPDGRARLRFGDDEYGLRPSPQTHFIATYRVGNGPSGNIGADTLHHVLTSDPRIVAVRNPLPGRGGTPPESLDHVRQLAPHAFRAPMRAVTPQDYATTAARHPAVQQAVATERWTGSWYTVFLAVDRVGGGPVDADFETELRAHLERYRMAGDDLEIDGPHYVPLEIQLRVCVLPEYFRSDVARTVRDVLGNRDLPGSGRGLFHPDRLTFGQTVRLSRIYATAHAVDGVRYVEALTFGRLGDPSRSALTTGDLPTGRMEIPRLDDDPNFPERGILRLSMEGGR